MALGAEVVYGSGNWRCPLGALSSSQCALLKTEPNSLFAPQGRFPDAAASANRQQVSGIRDRWQKPSKGQDWSSARCKITCHLGLMGSD